MIGFIDRWLDRRAERASHDDTAYNCEYWWGDRAGTDHYAVCRLCPPKPADDDERIATGNAWLLLSPADDPAAFSYRMTGAFHSAQQRAQEVIAKAGGVPSSVVEFHVIAEIRFRTVQANPDLGPDSPRSYR
jgi:hypothetical protein